MSVGTGGEGAPMLDINTTPLIDVMLCLLIIVIYSVPMMTHAIKLDMPQPSARPPIELKPEVVQLEIDFDGALIWNGSTVASMKALEGYLASAAAQPEQPELHLVPDRRVKYDVVAQVMAAAQRHHLRKMGFVNTSDFKN